VLTVAPAATTTLIVVTLPARLADHAFSVTYGAECSVQCPAQCIRRFWSILLKAAIAAMVAMAIMLFLAIEVLERRSIRRPTLWIFDFLMVFMVFLTSGPDHDIRGRRNGHETFTPRTAEVAASEP
jgi:hypothetical protein